MSPESPARSSKYSRVGKYELIKHIATGGMGAVYRARDTEADREVALKVLPADKAVKPILRKRFEREAQVGAKLKHENIVEFYDNGEANGFYFLALEYIEGIDLHQYIHRKKRLDVRTSKNLITQAARALEYLHANGIVHRDIKPSNFLVMARDGKPHLKLIDLGLAKEVDDDEGRVTKDGTTLGTIDYMAPEQARDAGTADVRADIYSLGCTWYHMLTGKPPFPEGSLAERLYKHVEVPPPDIREVNETVPDDVIDIIGKMLAKKPADRYATPTELLRDLENPQRKFKPIGAELLSGLAGGEEPRAKSKPSSSEFKRTPPPSDADLPWAKPVNEPAPRRGSDLSPLHRNLIIGGVIAAGLFFLSVVLYLVSR